MGNNTSDTREFFPGRADTADLSRTTVFCLQRILGFICIFTPKVGCIFQLSFTIVHKQIDRLIRNACKEHAIIASELELRAKMPTGIGIPPPAGDWRLCYGSVPATPDGRRSGEWSGNQSKMFIR